MRQRGRHPSHDGIDNVALLQDYENGAGKANQQRRKGNVAEARYEALGSARQAQAAEQAGSHAEHEKQRAHLVEIPAQGHHAVAENAEHDQQQQQHQAVAAAPGGIGGGVGGRYVGHYAVVDGVAHGAGNPEGHGGQQQGEPVAPARKQRQLGQLLGDAHLKRVYRTKRRPHDGRPDAGRHGGNDRIAQPAHQHKQHGHQGHNFLAHVFQRAHRGKEQAHHRNHQHLAAVGAGQQPVYAVA